MGMVGQYSLDLFCDHPEHANPEMCDFYGQDFEDCARKAREAGWTIRRVWPERADYVNGWGRCICPEHSGKLTPPRRKGGAR